MHVEHLKDDHECLRQQLHDTQALLLDAHEDAHHIVAAITQHYGELAQQYERLQQDHRACHSQLRLAHAELRDRDLQLTHQAHTIADLKDHLATFTPAYDMDVLSRGEMTDEAVDVDKAHDVEDEMLRMAALETQRMHNNLAMADLRYTQVQAHSEWLETHVERVYTAHAKAMATVRARHAALEAESQSSQEALLAARLRVQMLEQECEDAKEMLSWHDQAYHMRSQQVDMLQQLRDLEYHRSHVAWADAEQRRSNTTQEVLESLDAGIQYLTDRKIALQQRATDTQELAATLHRRVESYP